MKKWLFILLAFALSTITGCATNVPTPTAVLPTRTRPALNTVPPPTITETAVAPTATATPPPTNTAVPPTITPTPTIDPPPIATPPGQIFFMWTSNPRTPQETWALYRAVPNSSPDEWLVTTIIENVAPRGGGIKLSPDQSKFAISLVHDTDGDGELIWGGRPEPITDFSDIFIYDLLQDETWLLPNTRKHSNFVWMPDSQSIISISDDNKIMNTFLNGTPPETLFPLSTYPGGSLTVSPDGALLLFTTTSNSDELWAYDRDTDKRTMLRSGTGLNFGASPWNASGDWWAYGDTAGNTFVLNRDTISLTELAPNDRSGGLTWSSDGSKLTYTTNGNILYLWEPHTSSSTEILTADLFFRRIWSPHENVLAVNLTNNDSRQLVLLDADTGNTRILFEAAPEQTIKLRDWSPDGKWLLLVIEEAERSGIYALHVENGTLHQIMDTTGGISNYSLWVPSD